MDGESPQKRKMAGRVSVSPLRDQGRKSPTQGTNKGRQSPNYGRWNKISKKI